MGVVTNFLRLSKKTFRNLHLSSIKMFVVVFPKERGCKSLATLLREKVQKKSQLRGIYTDDLKLLGVGIGGFPCERLASR